MWNVEGQKKNQNIWFISFQNEPPPNIQYSVYFTKILRTAVLWIRYICCNAVEQLSVIILVANSPSSVVRTTSSRDTMTESQNQLIEFMIQPLMSSIPHSSVRTGISSNSSLLLVSILETSCHRFNYIGSRTHFHYFHDYNSSTEETSRNVPPSLALL